MRINHHSFIMPRASILLLLVLLTVSLSAPAAESEEGFEPLFNGTNLDGWIIQGLEKAGPKILEDGVLSVGGWDYWALITKKEFKNFIFRFDVKFDERGNSGILIHTPKKEVYKSSFEIQLDADYGADASKKSTGAIFGFVAPTKNAAKPLGEWNSVEVKYVEPKIWVTINGEVVQDGVDISAIEGLKHKFDKGGIAIQRNDYKKTVYFKNIRAKSLED
ncbi:MAG: DUF1080 domain-containing protein [Candidatus Omnitrophota bacterium]|jgi:hypothetical protein|nr:MAG: DUF1080 domain-containing protein [Candidatus Omnitrophota bacterium]